MFLAAVLAIAPWTVRNYARVPRLHPVSDETGYTIAGTYDQVSRANRSQPAVWVEAEHGASPEYAQILFDASIARWGELTYGDKLQAQAINEIKADPGYVLKVGYWNTIRMFHLGELDLAVLNLSNTDIPQIPALFEIYGFYPLGVLALAGLLTRRARRAPKWLWLVPLCLITSVFITGFIRFRVADRPLPRAARRGRRGRGTGAVRPPPAPSTSAAPALPVDSPPTVSDVPALSGQK